MPFFVNNYLSITGLGNVGGGIEIQLQMILVSNYLSLGAITYLIFVPWKKGPEWYLKVSPRIFYFLVYLNYIILPAINILIMIYFTVNPNYDLKLLPLESWVIFFTIVCFSRLLEFFTSLKKILLDDARIYLETRKMRQEGQNE